MTRSGPKTPIATQALASHFREQGVCVERQPRLELGFGEGRAQYRFMDYALPGPGFTMGIFFEWHFSLAANEKRWL